MLCMSVAKSGKKRFWIIFTAVIAVIVAGVAVGVGIVASNLKKAEGANVFAENPHGFIKLGVRPSGERNIYMTSFDKMSAEELKEAALKMYLDAGINFKMNDVVVYDNCHTSFSVLNIVNLVNIDSVVIKNDDEYFRVDYRLKNKTPFLDAFKSFEKQINDSLELVLTERTYATAESETAVYQKVRNAYIDENKSPYAIWDDPKYTVFTEQRDKPIFSPYQEGVYGLTAHTVTTDTIESADINYFKAEGYYEINIVLDVNNPVTTETAVGNIRKGSGDENANFDKLNIVFSVWDNGYLRAFKMEESWKANAMGIELLKFASVFNYDMYFSYASEDCNLAEYYDYVKFMESGGTEIFN